MQIMFSINIKMSANPIEMLMDEIPVIAIWKSIPIAGSTPIERSVRNLVFSNLLRYVIRTMIMAISPMVESVIEA